MGHKRANFPFALFQQSRLGQVGSRVIRNYAIRVPNSERLDDCFRDLQDLLATLPASPTDEWITDNRLWPASKPPAESMAAGLKRRAEIAAIAEVAIRRAVRARELVLRVMTNNGPEEVDNHDARATQLLTLKVGRYVSLEEPSSPEEDHQSLWILKADWDAFKARFESSRESVTGLVTTAAHVASPEDRASSRQSTTNGELECRQWLASEFEANPDGVRVKSSYREKALEIFAGRLSGRGFDNRVWPELARQYGRNKAGAKKKS